MQVTVSSYVFPPLKILKLSFNFFMKSDSKYELALWMYGESSTGVEISHASPSVSVMARMKLGSLW